MDIMQHPDKPWDIQEAIMDQACCTLLLSCRALNPAHDGREIRAGGRAQSGTTRRAPHDVVVVQRRLREGYWGWDRLWDGTYRP